MRETDSEKLEVRTRPLVVTILLLGLWWFVSTLRLINPLFLPTPLAVGKALINLISTSTIYIDAWATVYRALIGLLISIVVSVPAGLMFGRFPSLYRFVELPIDFLRSIPSSALFFLFILFFGLGDMSKTAVVIYGCSPILLINTIYGAKPSREKADRINMLRSFRAKPLQIFYLSVLRDALPNIMAGVRICVSLSLVLVIVTEMFLSANSGLGKQIYDFYLSYRVPEMYAVLLILGLIGFSANKFTLLLERRLSFWAPNTL